MSKANSNPSTRRLARLLSAVDRPLYLVAPSGRIEFANRALANWLGMRSADLVGRQGLYRSAAQGAPADSVADALCPPPEVFAGESVENLIHLPGVTSHGTARARFLPLPLPDNDLHLVLVVLDLDPQSHPAAAPPSEAAQLHARLQALRQEKGQHIGRLLGASPRGRRVRAQIELAMQSGASLLIVAPPGGQAHLIAREIHAARVPSTTLLPLDSPRLDAESIGELLQPYSSPRERGPDHRVTLLCLDADQLDPAAQLELESRLRAASAEIRIISTAQRSLESLAGAGEFRLELACRLSTTTITVLPLAERKEELPLVAQALLEELNATAEKQLGGFTPEALDRLAEHGWPGDVDELTELVREAWQKAKGPLVGSGDLPPRFLTQLHSAGSPPRRLPSLDLDAFLGEIETELLQRALTLAKGNKTKAAKMLGMTRPRLYRRLVQRGLEQPDPAAEVDQIDWLDNVDDETPPAELES